MDLMFLYCFILALCSNVLKKIYDYVVAFLCILLFTVDFMVFFMFRPNEFPLVE